MKFIDEFRDGALARKIADSFSIVRYLRYDIGEGRPIARDKATSLLGAEWRPLDATVSDTIADLRSVNAALRPAETVG